MSITAARGGRQTFSINKTMFNTPITDEHRKAFADFIRDAERRFDAEFNLRLDSLKHDLSNKFDGRSKVRQLQLLEMMRVLRGKLSEASAGLRKLGFHVDDGIVTVDYESSGDPRKELEEVKQVIFEERDKAKAKFRQSIFNVLSSQTVEEARKIVEEVLA
jgi:hypothetical protein